jgi:ATP/maltotriose-dependent transcriptional regulator MalT
MPALARSPLSLESAPAGYGKTVLVLGWLRPRDLANVRLSPDAGGNDPARFERER